MTQYEEMKQLLTKMNIPFEEMPGNDSSLNCLLVGEGANRGCVFFYFEKQENNFAYFRAYGE